jgi:potassium/hydrogen antiporter
LLAKTNNKKPRIFLNSRLFVIGLPEKTIIRHGNLVMPTGGTELQQKDILYILTAKEQVANVKLVFAEELMI